MQYYQFHYKVNLPKLNPKDDEKSIYTIFYFENIDNYDEFNLEIINLFSVSYVECCKKISVTPTNSTQWKAILYNILKLINKKIADEKYKLIKLEIKLTDTISLSTADDVYIGRNTVLVKSFPFIKKVNAILNIEDDFDKDQNDINIKEKLNAIKKPAKNLLHNKNIAQSSESKNLDFSSKNKSKQDNIKKKANIINNNNVQTICVNELNKNVKTKKSILQKVKEFFIEDEK